MHWIDPPQVLENFGCQLGQPSENEFATSINTSFTYLGSYADSRMTCQLISWQLPRGFENMKPSSGNA
jgi:hypothetical protein